MSAFSVDDYISQVIDGEKRPVSADILKGKILGLYFSAHWCPPCRRFTPILAQKYKDILAEGNNFDIIFISGDENEEAALEYFSEMPWKMLKFNETSKIEELNQKYEIEGIPSLVILDESGEIITKDGRSLIVEEKFSEWKVFQAKQLAKAKELELLKASFKPSSYFGSASVRTKDGNILTSDYLKDKVVGIYFSAHWCPPCRGFTPMLAEKYLAYKAAGKPFEIIFVSSDRDEASAAEYFASMPWAMLPFLDRDRKKQLSELFSVEGIPTLILCADPMEEGLPGLIIPDGRSAIMNVPFDELRAVKQAVTDN